MAFDLMPGFGAFTPAAIVASGSTWNSADKSATIDLSGSDLIATAQSGGSSGGSLRGTTSKSAGKWHFEFVCGAIGTGAGVGFANSAHDLSVSNYLGGDGEACGWFSTNSQITINNANGGAAEAFTTGDVLAWEIDIDAELVWVAKNAGNWNNSGTANPATGTGGHSFAAMNAGPWFIGASIYNLGSVTLRTVSGQFTRGVSSGFAAWG